MAEQWYTVGEIANTHGIRGEVKIVPHTDFAEQRFARGSKLWIHRADEPGAVQVEVLSSRNHKNTYIVKLKGFDNINEVEKFKGSLLKITGEHREKLDEGEFYYTDIIGCEVITEEEERLGVVTEILRPGANDVWVVELENGKELLLPYIDDVVLKVNVHSKKITVRLLEGLM
ncbi:ribosome maturation factor RimM [Paenibacillus pasadenensis]|uniref:ribosome maturation factor RimM n=1 Tax=Paenibacillus pasadenensis TaxID=217090 RepID=UPI00203D25AA|nr:ribosome maturation factor RimM [Paenibacillus pasadenensis]MCM3746034.1 ribosome maturation factor RimM [Paenibacillus pasadenensis]